MSAQSKIEWTDATWNPIVGCSIVSPGCTNCYAMRDAWRKHHIPLLHRYRGLTKKVNGKPVWTGRITLAPEDVLLQPLHWKKPRMIFVNSMGDLFHESIPDEWIDKVFAVMALCPQHTFQVLTKRAERMRAYFCEVRDRTRWHKINDAIRALAKERELNSYEWSWPLDNVWLGISAERQQEADERIPHLIETPAAIRFISAEPLLGPIDLTEWLRDGCPTQEQIDGPLGGHYVSHGTPRFDWLIAGGESGHGARPMHPDWARSLRDQCKAAGVPFFFKQWGEWLPGHHYTDELKEFDSELEQSRFACMDWNDDEAFETEGLAGWDDLGDHAMWRVGKKRAGRLLDGVEHSEFPVTPSKAEAA